MVEMFNFTPPEKVKGYLLVNKNRAHWRTMTVITFKGAISGRHVSVLIITVFGYTRTSSGGPAIGYCGRRT